MRARLIPGPHLTAGPNLIPGRQHISGPTIFPGRGRANGFPHVLGTVRPILAPVRFPHGCRT